MKHRLCCAVLVLLSLVLSMTAQTTSGNAVATTTTAVATTAQVPRLVRFSGALTDATGNAPGSVVGVTFSLYAEQSGGAPLWSEVQNVQVDKTGHYTALLGFTQPDGLPIDLFTAAQAQWLGVRVEAQAEQPRIMLLSVPYALKAADAETFGGKPPSAYASASSSANSVLNGSIHDPKVKNDHPLTLSGSGTTDYIPLWTNASTLSSSVIYQGSGHEIGIGTSNPVTPLEVTGSNSVSIVDVTQTGSSGNAVSGDITATSGNGDGVAGSTASPAGTGVIGLNTATTGVAVGTGGSSSSSGGAGVEGEASSPSGTTFGVSGSTLSPAGTGVIGQNLNTSGVGYGVVGNSSSSTGVGVAGNASSTTGANFGMFGETSSTSGVGVSGSASATTGFAIGVSGESVSTSGVGVLGNALAETGSAFGVKGTTASSAGVGVYGIATSDSGENLGVEGTADSSAGSGVQGTNSSTTGSAFGVTALTVSTAGIAMYAVAVEPSITTGAARPVAVWGSTTESGGVGVAGTADDGYAMAAANYSVDSATVRFENQEADDDSGLVVRTIGTAFDGSCFIDVSGDLICTGTVSGSLPVDNGTRRVALYAMEAPENWFEDAGSARLAHGSAVVPLESTFAQTVNSGVEYHVFLTPKGDCKGLYVTNETAASFEVRELGSGKANIAFDYRIMARRKGYENVRLADKTKLSAKSAAQDAQMQRKPPKLPPTPSSAGRAVQPPRPPLRTASAVPQPPPAHPVVKNNAGPQPN
ncbi:MAG: hypothetical protein ACLP3R_03375 [Candidatus Korobacteraceae bacterium]